MGHLFNVLVEFFEKDDWDFQWMEGMNVLSMGFSGKNGKWTCYAQAREEQQQFVFYSVCPINVPAKKRVTVAEFITRANYGMIIGNFEMDWEDGEVRYKTSIDIEGAQLIPALIKQMVYANVLITDRYLPGLMAVMFADVKPATEVKKIETSYFSLDDDGLDDLDDLDDLDELDDLDDLDELDDLDDLDDLDIDDFDDLDDDDDDDDGGSDSNGYHDPDRTHPSPPK